MRGRYARPAERVRQSLTVRRSRPQLTHERYRALRNSGSGSNAAGWWGWSGANERLLFSCYLSVQPCEIMCNEVAGLWQLCSYVTDLLVPRRGLEPPLALAPLHSARGRWS